MELWNSHEIFNEVREELKISDCESEFVPSSPILLSMIPIQQNKMWEIKNNKWSCETHMKYSMKWEKNWK